jgi:hypothetical protein
MPEEKPFSLPTAVLAGLKDAFAALREILLLILFVILLFFPKSLNSRLADAGLTKIDGGVFTWQQKEVNKSVDQSKAAAQANSAATDSLTDVKAALVAIASESTDKKIKDQANATLQKLDGSLVSLQAADQSITKSLLTQQAILQPPASASPSAPAAVNHGWTYLGEIDSAKQHWMIPPQPKIAASSPMPAVGQTVTLTDDLYLRADKGPGQTFNQAPIIGALRAGTAVAINDVQTSHALNGGQFVWAKVKANGNQ